MSEGNRFWRQSNTFGLLVNPNYATHRELGDIPGCVPAVDVYVGISQEAIDKWNNDYQVVWDAYRNGDIGHSEWINHSIHRRKALSPIRNPSTPVEKSRYIS